MKTLFTGLLFAVAWCISLNEARAQKGKAEAPSLSGNRPWVVTKVHLKDNKKDEPIADFDDNDAAWKHRNELQEPVKLSDGYYYTVYPRRGNTTSSAAVKPKPNTPADRPGAKPGLDLWKGLKEKKWVDLEPLGGRKIVVELKPDKSFVMTGGFEAVGKWSKLPGAGPSTIVLQSRFMRFSGQMVGNTVKGEFTILDEEGNTVPPGPEKDRVQKMEFELKGGVPSITPTPLPTPKAAISNPDAAKFANTAWVRREGPFTQVGYVGPMMHEHVAVLLDDGRFVVLSSHFISAAGFNHNGINAHSLSEQAKWEPGENGLIKVSENEFSWSRGKKSAGSSIYRAQNGNLQNGGLNGAYFEANARFQHQRLSPEQTAEAIARAKKATWR